MKKKTFGKRILAVVMALCIVMMYSGVAFAEENGHVEGCGYVCTHVHDDTCGFVAAIAGSECTHQHDAQCGYTEDSPASCTHVHDADCGYVAAVEGSPCNHECTDEEWVCAEGCTANVTATETVAMIGDVKYATLDEAIEAAESGDTIVVLTDTVSAGMSGGLANSSIPTYGVADLEKNKTIVIKGAEGTKPTIRYDNMGIRLSYANNVTFENVEIIMTTGQDVCSSVEYAAPLYYSIFIGQDSTLALVNASITASHESSSSPQNAGIYVSKGGKLIMNESALTIDGYYDGITFALDGSARASEFTAKDSTINCSNNGYTAFTGNGCETTFDNTAFTANGLNTNNRGISTYYDGKLTVKNNSSITITGGKFRTGKTDRGAMVVRELSVDETSALNLSDNTGVGLNVYNYSSSSVYEAKATIAAGSDVKIINNTESGIYSNGTLEINAGTITGNGKDNIERGAGVYNAGGTVSIAAGVKLYNNHASKAGDDIYSTADGSLLLGKVCTEKLTGTSDDCTDTITGWYYDEEVQAAEGNLSPLALVRTGYGSRWSHDTAADAVEYNAEDSGVIALKAAHGEIKNETPGTIIPTPENPQNPSQDNPTVNPDGTPDDIPSDNTEDKPSVNPNGGSDAIDGDDSIDSDAMGDPDAIDDDEDISAEPSGVKTSDSTAMIPWVLAFGTAIMMLAVAVALRRREE